MSHTYKLKLLIFLAAGVVMSGCGKYQKSNFQPATAGPTDPTNINGTVPGTPGHNDPLDPNAGVWTSGATAELVPVNTSVFDKWVAGHPVEPKNILINVDLKKATGKRSYSGTVKIRYQHNGATYEAVLKSGTGQYEGSDYYRYNYWFNYGGKEVFSGFFDDKVGGLVLVIDDTIDLGDGGGATQVSGEVWFKNFQSSWAAYDEGASWSVVLPCWFRSIGPYDCRSDIVMNKSRLYPTDRYQKLGDFVNMNKIKAFAQ